MLDWWTLGILVTGTLIKIVLLIFCLRQKTSNGDVLAMDQRNDIVTNLVALAGAAIGAKLWLYADPIGAILVRYVPPISLTSFLLLGLIFSQL